MHFINFINNFVCQFYIYTFYICFQLFHSCSSNNYACNKGLYFYEFNKQNSITAKSGKNKYKFDITQESFAWMTSNKQEKKMIKIMQKGSRIMVTGYNQKGSQTIDHYSLLGFTKAYKATKANCS